MAADRAVTGLQYARVGQDRATSLCPASCPTQPHHQHLEYPHLGAFHMLGSGGRRATFLPHGSQRPLCLPPLTALPICLWRLRFYS